MSENFNSALDYSVTKRIYLTKDRRAVVPENNKRAAFLLVGVPGPVTRTMAKRIVSFKNGIQYLRTLDGERIKAVDDVQDEDTEQHQVETSATLKRFTSKHDLIAFADNAFGVQLEEDDTRAQLTNQILDAQDKQKDDESETAEGNQGNQAEGNQETKAEDQEDVGA